MNCKILLTALLLLSVVCVAVATNQYINKRNIATLDEVEVIQYPFKLVMGLNKTTYSLGETVNITISLANTSDENRTVSLMAGGDPKSQFDFLIYDQSNDLIYRYSAHRGYYSGGPSVLLTPRQSITATHQWEQNDDDGGVVAPGKYYVVSRTYQIFHLDQPLFLETPRLEITIKGSE